MQQILVEVKEGQLFIEPYEYFDRDAMFICTPDVLVKIADGEMDPVWAFTTQKLKVEGNIDKALKLKDIIELKKKNVEKKGVIEKIAAKKTEAKKKSTNDIIDKKVAAKKAARTKSSK